SDMSAARRVARYHRVPLIFDPLTSRYEERVVDRRIVSPRSPLAWWYKASDAAGCRAADRALLETDAQIGYFVQTFGSRRAKRPRARRGSSLTKYSTRLPSAGRSLRQTRRPFARRSCRVRMSWRARAATARRLPTPSATSRAAPIAGARSARTDTACFASASR